MNGLPALHFSWGGPASPYLTFGLSPDAVPWLTLVAALVIAFAAAKKKVRDALARAPAGLVLGALAVLAGVLSALYLAHYLRGGPRIVDATSYFLEARALAQGDFWFPVPEPRASFHGRFLLSSSEGLAVLFPPGYPLVLSLGFWLGAPLAIGPLIGAALVPATYGVARAFGAERPTAYAAAALGVASAALRYHTADTMSHGLSALLGASMLALAARDSRRSAVFSGACAGLLIATRPVTGIALLTVVAFGVRTTTTRRLLAALAAAPLLGFFLFHQYRLAGEWLRSSQSAYYAVADGPAGCFRYGFGPGIGCWFEHGDFVRSRLGDSGYGFSAALGNLTRRLLLHLDDVANAAPLALLVPVGAAISFRQQNAKVGAFAVVAVMLAYVPFYFEGSYPGGGARFFADVLPLEHAFLAIALTRLGYLPVGLPFSLLGFALHTSHQHDALARREGGRPMFEPAVLESHGVQRGLVFVSTDHGFNLGHDPGASTAHESIVVARARGDALDHLLWTGLGRPPAFRYRYDPRSERAVPALEPFVPPRSQRIEGESLYPPVRVSGGFAYPEVRLDPCSSRGRALKFRAAARTSSPKSGHPSGPIRVTLRLPSFPQRFTDLEVGWLSSGGKAPTVAVRTASQSLTLDWREGASEVPLDPAASPCWSARLPGAIRPGGTLTEVTFEASAGALDYLELLEPAPPEGQKR